MYRFFRFRGPHDTDGDDVVSARKASQISVQPRLGVRRQGLQPDMKQAVSRGAVNRLLRVFLRRKRFGEQGKKQPELVPVEPSQV